jgi:glycosyltransferase involved in cell wall biosynthesis
MKVLYIIDSLEGYGAEKSIVEIALNLKEITPVFVHLYKGQKLKTQLQEQGLKVYSLNFPYKHNSGKVVEQLIPIVRSENPSIIHSTLFRSDLVARRLKSHFPEKTLVGSLVSNSYSRSRYGQMNFLRRLKLFSTQLIDRFTAGQVDYFICNSKAIMHTNRRALNISEEKVRVIYRGRKLKKSGDHDSGNCDLLKKELNPTEHRIFLNVGRLNEGKGQLDLVRAFAALQREHSHVRLLIAGEGDLRSELEEMIQELGLQEKVLLLGYREDIEDLLDITEFFVFPTYFEGLPGALVEALLAKKPAIISNIPENLECVPHGGAITFEVGNVLDLKEKMIKALAAKDWAQKIDRSFHFARKNFDIDEVSRQYENFYEEISRKRATLEGDLEKSQRTIS